MDRFSCPICKASLFQQPSAGGDGGNLNRPDNLKSANCCNGACGHLVHSECLLRTLDQSPAQGCPVCQGPVTPETCFPVQLPVSSPSANVLSGISGGASAQARGTPPPSSSSGGGSSPPPPPPPPPPPRIIYFVTAMYVFYHIDLTAVFTPDVCLRFDTHLERIFQLCNASGVSIDGILDSADGMEQRIRRLCDKFTRAPPQQQQQIVEHLTNAVENWFTQSDPREVRERLGRLAEEIAEAVEWWDKQNF